LWAFVALAVIGAGATVWFFRGRTEDPAQVAARAQAKLLADVRPLLDSGEFDEAIEKIKLFLSENPDAAKARSALAEAYCGQAESAVGGPDAARARELLALAEKHDANLPLLLAMRIIIHRKTGDSTAALLGVEEVSQKFAGRGAELQLIGTVLERHECYRDAAKVFVLAADSAEVRATACFHAAVCYHRVGRFALAMKYIDLAAALTPDDPKVAETVKLIEDARFVPDES